VVSALLYRIQMAYGRIVAMKATMVPIDKAGRVVIPKWVREGVNLQAGDELKVSVEGQRIQLELVGEDASLVRKGHALVFRGGSGKTITSDLVENLRDERLASLVCAARNTANSSLGRAKEDSLVAFFTTRSMWPARKKAGLTGSTRGA